MFTEQEANALITAEHFVLKNTDSSLIKNYSDAVNKIKAVIQHTMKEKTDLLSDRVAVKPYIPHQYISSTLAIFQDSIVNSRIVDVQYRSETRNEVTKRVIEPFALYISVNNSWTLIAKCCLRSDFRQFRLSGYSLQNYLMKSLCRSI